jgi:hypothetical protein
MMILLPLVPNAQADPNHPLCHALTARPRKPFICFERKLNSEQDPFGAKLLKQYKTWAALLERACHINLKRYDTLVASPVYSTSIIMKVRPFLKNCC